MSGVLLAFPARQAVAASGEFVDSAALFELAEHFVERALVRLFEVQAARDVANGRRIGANLQETQDIVGIEVRRSGHRMARADCLRQAFHSDSMQFSRAAETFLRFGGLMDRLKHIRRVALRLTCRYP